MKILFIFGSKYPGLGAASKRISNYSKCLQFNGDQVEILSIYPSSKNKFLLYFEVMLIPLYTFYKVLPLSKKYDLFFVYGFGLISKLSLVFISKLKDIKVVFEINEYPYSILGSKIDYAFKGFISIKRFFLERLIYPRIDGFIVISKPLYDYIHKHKSKKAKVLIVPILVDFNYYQVERKEIRCNRPYILHTSLINNNKDGVLDVLRAISIVNKQVATPIHFYVTSKLTLDIPRLELTHLIKSLDIENNVHFLGDLNESELLAFQQNCEMAVINKVDSKQNHFNFATKYGEFLALGKPIITTLVDEAKNYLKHNETCLEVPQNSPVRIAGAIMFLLRNPELGLRIGSNGRELSKKYFDIRLFSTRISYFFSSMIRQSNI